MESRLVDYLTSIWPTGRTRRGMRSESENNAVCEEATRLLDESLQRFREYLCASDDLRRTSTLDGRYGPRWAQAKIAERHLRDAFSQLDRHVVEHDCRRERSD